MSLDEKRRRRIMEKARQAQFDEDRQQRLDREGQTWQMIFLDALAVILLALAVAPGLFLLAFPPTSGAFLGFAIAASVCLGCSAISKIWSYKIKQALEKVSSDLIVGSGETERKSSDLVRNPGGRKSSYLAEMVMMSSDLAGKAEKVMMSSGENNSLSG